MTPLTQPFIGLSSKIRALESLVGRLREFLVFPSVIKAGIGFGGQYGEGVLIAHGNAIGYYNIVSASFGFQLGVQSQSIIIVFMTEGAKLISRTHTAGRSALMDQL